MGTFAHSMSASELTPPSSIPQEQREDMLRKIMGENRDWLTPDLLLQLALSRSINAKLIASEALNQKSAQIRAAALLGGQLSASASSFNDRNLSTNPFSTSSSEGDQIDLNYQRRLQSGTSLRIGASHLDGSGTFAPSPMNGGVASEGAFKETSLHLELRQSLWRDGFGKAQQLQQSAADLVPDTIRQQQYQALNQLALETFAAYYQVWQEQQNIRWASQQVESQKELVAIVQRQLALGTAEKPDMLEIQVALSQAEQQLASTKVAFRQNWQRLIISLSLPDELLPLDASRIPLQIDNPHTAALDICENSRYTSSTLAQDRAYQQLIQSQDLQNQARRSLLAPDLYAGLELRSNAIGGDLLDNSSDALGLRSPRLAIVVGIDITLGAEAHHAELLDGLKQRTQWQLQAADAQSERRIQGLNLCVRSRQLKNHLQSAAADLKRLEQRHQMEKKRFKLSRSSAFDVFRAISDKLELQRSHSSLRASNLITSWQIRSLTPQLQEHIQEILKRKDLVGE